ncbi:lipopolysaccharide heptosyltransferase I [Chlamydiota bacterium]
MKVLIVKTSSLGDIIQTFAVLDYLKGRIPEVEIDWVVENAFAELVRAHPHVGRVLTIESKKWRSSFLSKENRGQMGAFRKALRETRYDLLFDFQGNVKSSCVVASARAREKIGFGWKTLPEWPAWLFTTYKVNPPPGRNIREDYLALAQGYFQDHEPYLPRPFSLKLDSLQQQKLADLFVHNPKPTLVCPSAAWPNKCLSEEGLTHTLQRLNKGLYWFVWGSPAERELAIRLSAYFPTSTVLERLSLPLLQHVMARSGLVVAMDSLPLHLCGTTSTPTLSFFGPSSAQKYRPLGEQHLAVQGKCPYNVLFEKRCPQLRTCSSGLCLKDTREIDRIVEAEMLADEERPAR